MTNDPLSSNPMVPATDIEMRRGYIQGYGGPDQWWVLCSYQNVELGRAKCHSEREAGRKELLFEQHWKHDWEPAALAEAIAGKPEASTPCSYCGQHTLDGGSHQFDKMRCNREPCQVAHAEYAKEWEAERERFRVRQATQDQEDKERRLRAYEEAKTGFHWQHGWFFKRLPDGTVRVTHDRGKPWFDEILIPPLEWASIVCSVSVGGETLERWNASQDFHGRVTDETSVRQPCGPEDHLYVARAGSPVGDGVCIKCGAQEIK